MRRQRDVRFSADYSALVDLKHSPDDPTLSERGVCPLIEFPASLVSNSAVPHNAS